MHRNDFDAALMPGFRPATAQAYRELLGKQAREDSAAAHNLATRRTACPVCRAPAAAMPFMRKAGLELLRCPRCTVVYSVTVLAPAHDRAFYDASAFQAAYFQLKQNPAYATLEERKARYIVQCLMEWRAPGRLLEIGSGAGRLLQAARDAGWQATGIELNRAFAEESRRHGLHVIDGSFPEALPAAEREFDAIVMLDVLEHAIDPLAILEAARHVLNPGGIMAIQVPNFRSLLVRIEGADSNVVCHSHWNYFEPESLARCAAAAGLACVRSETIISELDRIRGFPPARIEAALASLGVQADPAGLDADWLHEHGLGYKVLAFFRAD